MLQVLDQASVDIENASMAYEQLRPGLGKKILAEVNAIIINITDYPALYAKQTVNTRAATLQIIPYQLYYTEEENMLYVLGLVPSKVHPRRKRSYIKDRIRSIMH